MFTVYPSDADVLNSLDDEADAYLDFNEASGAVSRTYPVINGIPAIHLSYEYFDTGWNCDAQDIYLALVDDSQSRLFEIDSQVCLADADEIQPLFDEMRESFKP